MGFKCPICLKDFGTDKKAWQKHIDTEHYAVGADCVKVVRAVTGVTSKIRGGLPITPEEEKWIDNAIYAVDHLDGRTPLPTPKPEKPKTVKMPAKKKRKPLPKLKPLHKK